MNDLVIAVKGAIQSSNFDEYKETILANIRGENKDLVSDEDFDRATVVVKACIDGEKAIKNAKDDAIAGMVDVNTLFAAMDEVSQELATTRLALSKRIKADKDYRKEVIIEAAEIFVTDHASSVDINQFGLICSDIMRDIKGKIASSITGKRSLKKMEEATMDEAILGIERLVKAEETVRSNIAYLEDVAADCMTIFHDKVRLLGKDNDTFIQLVDTRIAGHEADRKLAEQRKLEKERRNKEFQEAATANQYKQNKEMLGENIAAAPPAVVPNAPTYSICVTYKGDLNEASEAARMVRALFDDDAKALKITLNEVTQ